MATLYDAPTIEQNMDLVKNVFKIDVDQKNWMQASQVAQRLESLMRRNDEPDLPEIE